MREILFTEPSIKRENVLHVEARIHKVARMDQHIAFRKTWNPIVETVGIGDYDQSHPSTSYETQVVVLRPSLQCESRCSAYPVLEALKVAV